MSTKTKNETVVDKAEIAPEAEVVDIKLERTDEQIKNGWIKHEKCVSCGTTELKHYSGGMCTRCYTEKRNKKLGLGKYNAEMQAKKLSRLDEKIEAMNAKIAEMKAERKELAKITK